MKKKGQAEIIVSILIILLVLAAIFIIWRVVNGVIVGSSKEVNINPLFLKGDIEYSVIDNDNIQVRVERGAGDEEISGIKLFFDDDQRNTYTYEDKVKFPKELETKTYLIHTDELNPTGINFINLEEVSLRYLYIDKEEEEVVTQILDTSQIPDDTIVYCDDGDTVICYSPKVFSDTGTLVSCEVGTRTCTDGNWGSCLDLEATRLC